MEDPGRLEEGDLRRIVANSKSCEINVTPQKRGHGAERVFRNND